MATVTESTSGAAIEQIGETAGLVWQALHQGGRMSFTKLFKEVEAPRDLVLQAVGWLAREDKIDIDDASRTKTIGLR